MRKRKLITLPTMFLICDDLEIGVPLSRAMRNHDIGMSRPSVNKLVRHFEYLLAAENMEVNIHTCKAIRESLFPDWLVTDEQEQPDSMYYNGNWPSGEWVWTQ